MDRKSLASLIYRKLEPLIADLRAQYAHSKDEIGYFVVDDLFPEQVARDIYSAFPSPQAMKLKKSLREYKYIAAQMDQHDRKIEEALFAFQEPAVVDVIAGICGIKDLRPDVHLYAGGISLMGMGNYLNPHIDNSHDKDRKLWRVLNLLYYVTPDWREEYGGNLELWPKGTREDPVTIFSKFNRLAVMTTHRDSWHSVSPVRSDGYRCCISNYYFSSNPVRETDTFHITSFRGRPEQRLRDGVLRADAAVRMLIRKIFKGGIVETGHIYKKTDLAE